MARQTRGSCVAARSTCFAWNATPSRWIQQRRPFLHSITRPRNIRPALCAIRRFMGRIQTISSLNRKGRGKVMKHQIEFRRLLKLVLALAVATLLSPVLHGQAADDKKKDSNPPVANPTSVSIAVDSGRITTDLPAAVDRENKGRQTIGGL